MKKLIVITCFLISAASFAQSMFGKNPYKNQQSFDQQRVHWGYFLGFNSYDYKINYTEGYEAKNHSQEIQVKTTTGFNVGMVGNLRLSEYFDLRFEPGLYYGKKTLFFPQLAASGNLSNTRTINSTYINFPLLLKFSALRAGNIRPYLVGGFSQSLNLASNETSKDDNFAGKFRLKKWSTNYELGIGIDFYFEHFKFTPSIRGVFGINDELIRDRSPQSPWTGGIESMKTRAVLINFTFH
nr:porin family protein [uncultured Flavobacterium sp.]